ncbi:hypothetical protein [Nostoc sp.]
MGSQCVGRRATLVAPGVGFPDLFAQRLPLGEATGATQRKEGLLSKNFTHLERASYQDLRITNYIECFWQFGIQNFSVPVLIEISAGLQGD